MCWFVYVLICWFVDPEVPIFRNGSWFDKVVRVDGDVGIIVGCGGVVDIVFEKN